MGQFFGGGSGGGGGGISQATADARYWPQQPALVAPFDPRMIDAASVGAANAVWLNRVICPRGGTLTDLTVFIGTSSGNLMLGVYDTGDASAGNRTLLYTSGSVACGTGSTWQTPVNPNLTVTAGQQLDFALIQSDATQSQGRRLGFVAANNQLPANFWPATGGALPKLTCGLAAGGFALPTPIAEASLVAKSITYCIIARIS